MSDEYILDGYYVDKIMEMLEISENAPMSTVQFYTDRAADKLLYDAILLVGEDAMIGACSRLIRIVYTRIDNAMSATA